MNNSVAAAAPSWASNAPKSGECSGDEFCARFIA